MCKLMWINVWVCWSSQLGFHAGRKELLTEILLLLHNLSCKRKHGMLCRQIRLKYWLTNYQSSLSGLNKKEQLEHIQYGCCNWNEGRTYTKERLRPLLLQKTIPGVTCIVHFGLNRQLSCLPIAISRKQKCMNWCQSAPKKCLWSIWRTICTGKDLVCGKNAIWDYLCFVRFT